MKKALLGVLVLWGAVLGTVTYAYCGDGIIETGDGEQCDDIITTPGNGCSSSCKIEAGYSCEGAPSVCTLAGFERAKKTGGDDNDVAQSVTTDAAGNIYTVGYFQWAATFGSGSLTAGGADIFITKQSPDGTFERAKKAGGTDNDFANSVTTDAAGNIYTVGRFGGTATFGSGSLTTAGGDDIFITKFSTRLPDKVYDIYIEGEKGVPLSFTNNVPKKARFAVNNRSPTAFGVESMPISRFMPILKDVPSGSHDMKEMYIIPYKADVLEKVLKQ